MLGYYKTQARRTCMSYFENCFLIEHSCPVYVILNKHQNRTLVYRIKVILDLTYSELSIFFNLVRKPVFLQIHLVNIVFLHKSQVRNPVILPLINSLSTKSFRENTSHTTLTNLHRNMSYTPSSAL